MTLRRKDARSRVSIASSPSMTPMVDVVLVILVFFMASAAFLGPEWLLGIALPDEDAQGERDPFALPTPRFIVTLTPGDAGSIVYTGLGADHSPLGTLSTRLTQLMREVPGDEIILLIEADDAVPYEGVVRAREICQRVGVSNVGLR